MLRKFFSIGVVVVFLASAWSGALAKTFCPRAKRVCHCCLKKDARATQPTANFISRSMRGCACDMGDSSSKNLATAPALVNAFNSFDSFALLPINGALKIFTSKNPTSAVLARQHAPPAAPSSRHILLSVFRI
jgi:hypothetical protein